MPVSVLLAHQPPQGFTLTYQHPNVSLAMWGLLSDGGQHHKAAIPGHPNTPHKVRKRHVLQGVTSRFATSHASIDTTPEQTTTNVKHHLQTTRRPAGWTTSHAKVNTTRGMCME